MWEKMELETWVSLQLKENLILQKNQCNFGTWGGRQKMSRAHFLSPSKNLVIFFGFCGVGGKCGRMREIFVCQMTVCKIETTKCAWWDLWIWIWDVVNPFCGGVSIALLACDPKNSCAGLGCNTGDLNERQAMNFWLGLCHVGWWWSSCGAADRNMHKADVKFCPELNRKKQLSTKNWVFFLKSAYWFMRHVGLLCWNNNVTINPGQCIERLPWCKWSLDIACEAHWMWAHCDWAYQSFTAVPCCGIVACLEIHCLQNWNFHWLTTLFSSEIVMSK